MDNKFRILAETSLPTDWGTFRMVAFGHEEQENMPHVAMIHPDLTSDDVALLRIHSECMTGDLFHSNRCECGEQLHFAMSAIAKNKGLVLYLRQEGRGIGIINKMKAYNLQDTGVDTYDANVQLGFDADARRYDEAIRMLELLDIKKVKLLTNNPTKIEALEQSSIEVIGREPLIIEAKDENKGYLETKKVKFGHLL